GRPGRPRLRHPGRCQDPHRPRAAPPARPRAGRGDRGAHHRVRPAPDRRPGGGPPLMRPTRRAMVLVAAAIPLALVPALVSPRLWTLWLAFVLVVAVVAAADAAMVAPARTLRMAAALPQMLYIGGTDPATL